MPRDSREDKAERLRQWESTPLHITPEGLKKLKAKLEHLKSILPHLIDETARTAAYGDRSENVEYVDAKSRLRRTRGQILRIEDQLKKVRLIEAGPDAGGKIQVGSTVELITETGEARVYRIVGPHETNPSAGYISFASPLGSALIGHKEGETVEVPASAGARRYSIKTVS